MASSKAADAVAVSVREVRRVMGLDSFMMIFWMLERKNQRGDVLFSKMKNN
jgi:hypothetical protein